MRPIIRLVPCLMSLLTFAPIASATQCLTVSEGAGCNVPNQQNVCTFDSRVGSYTDCSKVCPTGDRGCYYRTPSDLGTTCSPAIACYSHPTCDCLPGGACSSDADCLGSGQKCDTQATRTCVDKNAVLPPAAPFIKHGNNGSVNCNIYCAGAQWGPVGQCVASQITTLPCDLTLGYLNAQNNCTCRNALGQEFFKPGNNGSVSCSTFCAGPQWGPVGSCVQSSVDMIPACSLTPGFLNAELTCYCR